MKRFAPPAGLQGNLPLVDMPSLEIPQQQELAIALMDLLVQVWHAAEHERLPVNQTQTSKRLKALCISRLAENDRGCCRGHW